MLFQIHISGRVGGGGGWGGGCTLYLCPYPPKVQATQHKTTDWLPSLESWGRKEGNVYLAMHSTHFIYVYIE